MKRILSLFFLSLILLVSFLYIAPSASTQALAINCTLNGASVAPGTEFCQGASYTGQFCTDKSTYGVCRSTGLFEYFSCAQGTRCGYASSTNVSCYAACFGATPTPTRPPGATATPTIPPAGTRYACQNNACVQSANGPYADQTCGGSCLPAPPPPPPISCPKCDSPFILNDSRTVCHADRKIGTLTTVSCPDIGGEDVSCKGAGTQGGCVASSGTTTNPECYINIPGYCDEQTGEQKLECDGTSCDTALGNFNTKDVGGFVGSLFTRLLGVVGGIAILLIIISGYRIMASRGNDDHQQLQQAREQLTAAVVGLLFVIFSLVALQVIGYDILRLPGFSP